MPGRNSGPAPLPASAPLPPAAQPGGGTAPGAGVPRAPALPAPVAPASTEPLFTELNTRRLGPIRRFFLRHPRVMDIIVAALVGVPPLVAALVADGGPRPVLLLLAIAGATVLMWRRRAPLVVAAAIGVLAIVTLAATGSVNEFDIAIGFTIYAVAASRPPRIAWLTFFALGLTTSAAVMLLQHPVTGPQASGLLVGPDPETSVTSLRVSTIAGLAIFSLAAIAIGTNVRNRRLHVAALVDRANRLTVELDQQVELAAAAERARIAREMHDVVAHSLSVMIALADGAGVALDRSPERAREAVTELSATGRSALADMRRVLGVLRDPQAPLGPQPGFNDLTALVERFRSAGMQLRTTSVGSMVPNDAALQLTIFRIAQESLTNALRHAPGARRVDLVIAYSVLENGLSRVEITVTDTGGVDGGPRPPAGTGTGGKGLIGMRERAAVYGGLVAAGPHDSGWRTYASLTWAEEADR